MNVLAFLSLRVLLGVQPAVWQNWTQYSVPDMYARKWNYLSVLLFKCWCKLHKVADSYLRGEQPE